MKTIRTGIALLTVVLGLPAGTLQAQESSDTQEPRPWIHIQVTEADQGKKVHVNLPLSLAEVALDLAPDDVIQHGHWKLKREDIAIADLRRAWNELKASGEAEFVTVEEKDKTVRIAREADLIRIRVEDRSAEAKQQKTVHIKLPVPVVDALLAGDGETLDVRAALAQLKGQRGEIVSVDDGDSRVRIWIDEGS